MVPSTPTTVGPFTASSSSITIAQNAAVNLVLVVSGSNLNLSCTAYPDDSAPTGIATAPPANAPFSPVIVTAGQPTIPTTPTTPTTPPTTPVTIPPGAPTGSYELYCPGTPVGNIVLNDVTTTASIPTDLSPGQGFSVSNFQTEVGLPSSIVSAAAALGNSAITGTATVKIDASGATPASVAARPIAINAPIPSPVPSSGLTLSLPSTPGTVGPFTAAGGAITMSIDRGVSLGLVVSGSTLNLTCTPYTDNSAPSGISSTAPAGSPISPVIAIGSTGSSTCAGPASCTTTVTAVGPTPTTVGSSPTTVGSTSPPTTTTQSSTASGEVTQAFETLFDPTASIADKVAAIQDGTSIETDLNQAFSSSLSSSATGVSVDDISFPDSSGCTQAGLPSPCATVSYDILGQGGTTLLPGNQGSAVSVDGTWLVSTNTACTLLQLFYQAEGKTGSPPGCPSSVAPTTATTADPSSPGGAATGSSLSGASDPPSKADPPSNADPVVQASSGSLAFTGLGAVAQWVAIVGGALIVLGFAMLVMVDTPRRLVYRLAHLNPVQRRTPPTARALDVPSASTRTDRAAGGEALWITGR